VSVAVVTVAVAVVLRLGRACRRPRSRLWWM